MYLGHPVIIMLYVRVEVTREKPLVLKVPEPPMTFAIDMLEGKCNSSKTTISRVVKMIWDFGVDHAPATIVEKLCPSIIQRIISLH